VWPAPGGPILVSADRRYLWRQLKTCFGVADPDPGAPLEPKLRARAQVIADWFTTHQDRDALKRDLDTARLAWAEIRHTGDVLAAPALARRDAIVEVTDGDGEKRSVVRMPYRFSDATSGPVRGVPEPGEHTEDILRDWTSPPDLPSPADLPAAPIYPGPADLPPRRPTCRAGLPAAPAYLPRRPTCRADLPARPFASLFRVPPAACAPETPPASAAPSHTAWMPRSCT
jgi:hypothetical protein